MNKGANSAAIPVVWPETPSVSRDPCFKIANSSMWVRLAVLFSTALVRNFGALADTGAAKDQGEGRPSVACAPPDESVACFMHGK